MRFKFAAAITLALASAALSAQSIDGTWAGTLHQDNKDHHIVLDIRPDGSGGHMAVAYVDARGADRSMDIVALKGNDVRIVSQRMNLAFYGTLSTGGDTMTGKWIPNLAYPLELHRTSPQEAWTSDTTPHTIRSIQTDKGVQLEVLDWGGSGPPAILLTGLGDNAHAFDSFAPKLMSRFHVYGITRRGYGASTWLKPEVENYTADRLGDDVLAVIDALKLDRPFLIGHSLAGEELSSVGTRHPEKVRGLIYLEAGYPYAFFDEAHPDFLMSVNQLRRTLNKIRIELPPSEMSRYTHQIQEKDLPQFQTALQAELKKLEGVEPTVGATMGMPPVSIGETILNGEQKYGAVRCPALFLFAAPHLVAIRAKDPKVRERAQARDLKMVNDQADAIAAAMPQAKIVRIPAASHFIFRSNEEQVLKEIDAFIAPLH